ncbi:MAG: SUMF1/EgtB/PvdO family nonheme iron enzyme [Phycisphaerales bacterium]
MNQVLGAALTLACASTTLATPIGLPGPGPDYGYQWATMGDAGNRDVSQAELDAWGPHSDVMLFTGGGVDYEYRISKYETTTAQWFEFVQVAFPSVQGNTLEIDRLSGGTITRSGGQWLLQDPMKPASPHWMWAARYCNWLHNGKGTDPASWESGVYDASTFYEDENGVPQHDLTRAPGAKFFLPTLDEWKKAGHWDPEKNDGEGGYWLYPHGSDQPPVPGPPDEGGETTAGYMQALLDPALQTIGLYPDVFSPWGLLDMSGGVRENTQDTTIIFGDNLHTITAGTSWSWGQSLGVGDRFHGVRRGIPHWDVYSGLQGFRVAGVIPSPGVMVVAFGGVASLVVRRRRDPNARSLALKKAGMA